MKSGQGGIPKNFKLIRDPSAAAATDVLNYAIYWEPDLYE
jgi:hypothetical protein